MKETVYQLDISIQGNRYARLESGSNILLQKEQQCELSTMGKMSKILFKDSYLDLLSRIKFLDGIQVILRIHSLDNCVQCHVHFDVQERYRLYPNDEDL